MLIWNGLDWEAAKENRGSYQTTPKQKGGRIENSYVNNLDCLWNRGEQEEDKIETMTQDWPCRASHVLNIYPVHCTPDMSA